MTLDNTPPSPADVARALGQTDDLAALLNDLETGDRADLKARLQQAIAQRQHLIAQIDANPTDPTPATFQVVFERAATGIAQLDVAGHFRLTNPHCQELLGYDRETFATLDFPSLLPERDRPGIRLALQQLVAGEIQSITYEKPCGHRQGHAIWLHLSLAAMRCPVSGEDCILLTLQPLGGRAAADKAELQRKRDSRSLVENLPGVVFTTDRHGAWTFLNSAWTQLLGFSLSESLGSSILDFIEPGDRTTCWTAFEDLQAGRRHLLCCEVRCRTKHDPQDIRRLEILARPLYDADGVAIGTAGSIADITERCQTEDRLRAVIDTVPGLVSWVSRDGSYLGVNQRLADALQRDPEEFVGRNVGFLSGNPAFQEFLTSFLTSSNTHISRILEAEVDGNYYSYSIAGQKYQDGNAAVLVGIDITHSKKAERALREGEEKFRQLAENIEQVFWMLDLARKKMIYVSPAYEGTWGRPLQTVYRPQAWMDTVHPEDYPHVLKALPQQIRGEYDIEYRILRPNGEVRWIRDRAFPVRDEGGSVYRLAGIAEDITERKRAKEALQKRERFLTALVAIQRRLLAATVEGDLYSEVLAILGRVAEADTIYVYEDILDDRPGARLRAQWCAPTTDAKTMAATTELDYARFSTTWLAALRRGEQVRGSISDLDASDRTFYRLRATQTMLMLPLTVAGRFFGFIGLESSRQGAAAWDALAVGLLSSATATIALARERQLNQEELHQQLTAIEASTDGIFIVSTDGKLRYINSAYHRILGYNTIDSLLTRDWREVYPPEQVAEIEASMRVGGKWSGEAIAQRLDGSTLMAELSMTVTHDDEIVGVCRDISERKQAEANLKASLEEKKLLLKEVHHRVKNNLQVISSLFNLSAHTIEDPGALAILAESQNRIGSMALIHGKLYQSENLSNIDFVEYIRDLIYHLLASYNADPERIRTELHVEEIALNLDAAIPCGLLFNELISNALKHAFPNRRPGHLRVDFTNAPDAHLFLRVADDGVGLPAGLDPAKTTSLGLSLIVSLTQQLRGSLKMYNDPGATFEITFPQPVERKRF